jgi:hypothetical protein
MAGLQSTFARRASPGHLRRQSRQVRSHSGEVFLERLHPGLQIFEVAKNRLAHTHGSNKNGMFPGLTLSARSHLWR